MPQLEQVGFDVTWPVTIREIETDACSAVTHHAAHPPAQYRKQILHLIFHFARAGHGLRDFLAAQFAMPNGASDAPPVSPRPI